MKEKRERCESERKSKEKKFLNTAIYKKRIANVLAALNLPEDKTESHKRLLASSSEASDE